MTIMVTPTPAGFHSLSLPIAQLSLAAVLNCGQSFRWSSYPLAVDFTSGKYTAPTHEYRLCLRDRVVCLRQSPEALFYRSVFPGRDLTPAESALREAETLTWIKDYFQLDVDLLQLYDDWSQRDPVFRSLRSRFSGIRVLRQDPWENLISFICSSNNNIVRITNMVHTLCRNYSPILMSLQPPSPPSHSPLEAISYHPFPPPSVLAASDVASELRSLGFGYRADFVQRTARMLVDKHGPAAMQGSVEAPERWLMTLRNEDTAKVREELLKLFGVGRKVADCILLMSLDKHEIIPVDTHVHQIAVKHYRFPRPASAKGKVTLTPKLYNEISNRLGDTWGKYAGWAHSVLFTSDLRTFSAYGLDGGDENESISSPRSVSTDSRTRKRPEKGPPLKPSHDAARDLELAVGEGTSLAERVKKRRRTVAVTA
ncbi:DNA glycosylase [Scleroderma citrinum]